MIHVGDITKLHGWELEPVDCITGGSPCQDLSLAGKRAGLAGERSSLFMEQVRLVKEMRDATRTSALYRGRIKPRYKALGNSIAVGYANRQSGFWMNLMKRISAQYERSATLGSLFDGIGGFPLAWEFFNGKGSARWASEVEEFCIAVTKRRFPDGSPCGGKK